MRNNGAYETHYSSTSSWNEKMYPQSLPLDSQNSSAISPPLNTPSLKVPAARVPLHGQFQAEVPPTREDRIRVFSTFIYLSNCELHQMSLSSFDAPNTSSIFNYNSSGFGYYANLSLSTTQYLRYSWLQNSGRDSNFLQCRLKSENVRAMPI